MMSMDLWKESLIKEANAIIEEDDTFEMKMMKMKTTQITAMHWILVKIVPFLILEKSNMIQVTTGPI